MGSGASKRQASYALGDSGVKRQETGQGDPEEASRRGGSSGGGGGAGNGEGSAGAGAGGGASPRGGGTVAHLEAITGVGATAAAAGVMATGTPPPRDGAAATAAAREPVATAVTGGLVPPPSSLGTHVSMGVWRLTAELRAHEAAVAQLSGRKTAQALAARSFRASIGAVRALEALWPADAPMLSRVASRFSLAEILLRNEAAQTADVIAATRAPSLRFGALCRRQRALDDACALVARLQRRAAEADTVQRLARGRGAIAQARQQVSLKRLLDGSPWLQFTSECQRF
jgi:hypothetical protein